MIVTENIETKEECLDLIQRLMKQFGIILVKTNIEKSEKYVTKVGLINDKYRKLTFFNGTSWNSDKFPSMYVNPSGQWNGITNTLQNNTKNTFYGGRFATYNLTSTRDKSATNWPGYYHSQDRSGQVAWVPIIEIEEV